MSLAGSADAVTAASHRLHPAVPKQQLNERELKAFSEEF